MSSQHTASQPPPKSLLTIVDVGQMIGLGRSSIYTLRASGDFPAPVKIGRSVRWRADEVQVWINRRSDDRGVA